MPNHRGLCSILFTIILPLSVSQIFAQGLSPEPRTNAKTESPATEDTVKVVVTLADDSLAELVVASHIDKINIYDVKAFKKIEGLASLANLQEIEFRDTVFTAENITVFKQLPNLVKISGSFIRFNAVPLFQDLAQLQHVEFLSGISYPENAQNLSFDLSNNVELNYFALATPLSAIPHIKMPTHFNSVYLLLVPQKNESQILDLTQFNPDVNYFMRWTGNVNMQSNVLNIEMNHVFNIIFIDSPRGQKKKQELNAPYQ